MKRPVILLSGLFSAVAAFLVAGPACGALSTTLVNGNFEPTSELQSFDRSVDGWDEHETYRPGDPQFLGFDGSGNGASVTSYFAPAFADIPCGHCPGGADYVIPTSSKTLMLILGAPAPVGMSTPPHTAVVMQSIGTVDATDVGKLYSFTAGAVAWNWHPIVTPFSGNATLSFRTGATGDFNGTIEAFEHFNYGTPLGTEATVTTGVTAIADPIGTAQQDGTGDEGNMHLLTATYAPSLGDIGKMVSVVIDLSHGVNAPEGESRFLVGDAILSVMAAPAVPGDYNSNGVVDAADYVVWRDALGQNIEPGNFRNEVAGVTPGMVTPEDYGAWSSRFGNLAGSGSVLAVPEPTTVSLVALLFAIVAAGRGWAPRRG